MGEGISEGLQNLKKTEAAVKKNKKKMAAGARKLKRQQALRIVVKKTIRRVKRRIA